MEENQILAVLSGILRDVVNDTGIEISATTERPDVPGWDSFAYINFIAAVELEFGVKFKVAEIESFPNVGAIVRSIQSKVSNLRRTA